MLLVMIFGHPPAEVLTVLGTVGTLMAAARKYNLGPRRIAGWLVAVKNYETAVAAAKFWELEHEKCSGNLAQCQGGEDS